MNGPSELIEAGIIKPSAKDWRVRVFLKDGTVRTVRVSPSTLDEQAAISRALSHIKAFDASLIEKIESERVEKSTQVAPYGIIHK
jgi:hypothetical protein